MVDATAMIVPSDTIAERREAVRNLTEEGYSARETAEILGVSHETAASDVRNLTPLDVVATLAADEGDAVACDSSSTAIVVFARKILSHARVPSHAKETPPSWRYPHRDLSFYPRLLGFDCARPRI